MWLVFLCPETEFALAAVEVPEAVKFALADVGVPEALVCSGPSLEILSCCALPFLARQDQPLPRQSSPSLLSLAPWRLAASYLSFNFSRSSVESQVGVVSS